MSGPVIAVVDAGCGNLRSVEGAFAATGHPVRVTADPEVARRATHLVVPGQGAFGACVRSLARTGMRELVADAIRREVPYLGICLGLQILFERSDEAEVPGLGIAGGSVIRFEEGMDSETEERLKVPHMGWNVLEGVKREGPLAKVADGDHAYFVHSYHARPTDPGVASAWAVHGSRFVAAVSWAGGRIAATQFHPEKSGRVGLGILEAFAGQPA